MKTIALLIISTLIWAVEIDAQEIPYRADSTYKLELGMEYKKVPTPSSTVIKPGQPSVVRNSGHDFYLHIKLNLIELLGDDFRLKIVSNHNDLVLSKKLKKPNEFVIDIGRATEIKNGKAPSTYTIEFIGTDKTVQSIILIEFTEEGIFYVNKVQFGQI